MANGKDNASDPAQVQRFKEAARALGCDEDEAAFDETLRALASRKPKPRPENRPDKPKPQPEKPRPPPNKGGGTAR